MIQNIEELKSGEVSYETLLNWIMDYFQDYGILANNRPLAKSYWTTLQQICEEKLEVSLEEKVDNLQMACEMTFDILKEELECRRISQKKFSEILGVPYTMLNEILYGIRPITSDFALMIEAALNINPELLINMQARYNMALAREKKALSNRLNEIRKMCASLL